MHKIYSKNLCILPIDIHQNLEYTKHVRLRERPGLKAIREPISAASATGRPERATDLVTPPPLLRPIERGGSQ